MTRSTRADLCYGTAYGLALSAVIWSLVLAPAPLDAGSIALLALALLAGSTAPARLGPAIRWSAVYPVVVAALLLYGTGASVAAAVLGALPARSTAGRPVTRHGLRVALAALAATIAALGHGAAVARGSGPVAGLAAHALLFALGQRALAHASTGPARLRRALRRPSRRLLLDAGLALVGAAAGAGLAWLHPLPGAPGAMLGAAGLLVSLALARERRERAGLTRRARRRETELFHGVTETLAAVVEARDRETRQHLHRVRDLGVAVGRRLQLSDSEMEALGAAAVLHDIGKVAVPAEILSKPGRLSPREMECIKLHPEIGARILERLPFSAPLAPIVRHHHERWDGHGYPARLAGEEIPLGSRILAAVDAYDALTTERPYRHALPHDEAVAFLQRESSRMFDKVVVDALVEHFGEVVPGPTASAQERSCLEAEDEDGGGEMVPPGRGNLQTAQRELQTLYEIARAMDYGMALDEYLTLVSGKLMPLVPYTSLVVYFLEGSVLRATFAAGHAADKMRLVTVPLGERLSGWAAMHQKAAIGERHASPLERDGSRSDLEEWDFDPDLAALRSGLVAPLVAGERTLGVLALYDHGGRGFAADERRLLVRVAGHVAQAVERSGGPVVSPDSSLTDPLTGVPNARFLWLETAHRVSRAVDGRPGFGLLAFRVIGLEQVGERLGITQADRLLCRIARRFAGSCAPSETLVRFGPDLFLVLSAAERSGELIERWHALTVEVERPLALGDGGPVAAVRLGAAHAVFPDDGATLDELLSALDARLREAARGDRTVVPFRARGLAVS